MASREEYWDLALKIFSTEGTENQYNKGLSVLKDYLYNTLGIQSLYRYRPDNTWANRDKSIFESDKVWFQPIGKQNDELEFSFNMDYNDPLSPFLALCPSLSVLQATTEFLVHQFEDYKNKCSIVCLSDSYDNCSLWCRYANSHHGYCISYSVSDILSQFECSLLPVIYQNELPSFSDALLYEKDTGIPASYYIAYKRISTKMIKKWACEREWRVIRTLQSNNGKGMEIKFPKPTAVYLGYKAEKSFELEMKQICAKKNIPIFKMEKDSTSNTLSSVLIQQ